MNPDEQDTQHRAAQRRGFGSPGHFLDLATAALERQPHPAPPWIWREYQAIFMGRWSPAKPGAM